MQIKINAECDTLCVMINESIMKDGNEWLIFLR